MGRAPNLQISVFLPNDCFWDDCPNRRVLQASVNKDNFDVVHDEDDLVDLMSKASEFYGDSIDVYEPYRDIIKVFWTRYMGDLICSIMI